VALVSGSEVREVGRNLRVPDDVVEEAVRLCEKAAEAGIKLPGAPRVVQALAFLYVASKLRGYRFPERSISECSAVSIWWVRKVAAAVVKALRLEVPGVEAYVRRAVEVLNLGERATEVEALALRIIAEARRRGITSGARPPVLATAAVVVALQELGIYRRGYQATVCQALNVNDVSVRAARARLAVAYPPTPEPNPSFSST